MAEPKPIPQKWPLAPLLLFALLYGASVWLGMRLTGRQEHISAMWPASGVLLAVLLRTRFRQWPAFILVAALVEPLSYQPGLPAPLSAFVLALSNTLEASVGAFLLRRYARFRPSLERVRDVLALVGIGAMLCTLLSAAPGVTVLALRGDIPWEHWGRNLRVFWVGDAMGVLLVTPLLLTWASRGLQGWSRARLVELAAMVLALALTTEAFFRWAPDSASLFHPISYLAFPFALWAALRLEARGTAVLILALSTLILAHTLEGSGPFAESLEEVGPRLNERIVFVQSFLAAVSVSGLLMAAALSERQRAQEDISRLNRELRQSLEELAATQQELVRRERLAALGELSASVAHEVRNPLAALTNSVAALLRLTPPDEQGPTRELLGVMDEEVSRLDHLVNGLLDLTRPVEPRLLLQPLGAVVDEALAASLRAVPDRQRVRVTRAQEPEPPEAPLDAQLLHLALSNLFINALQALPGDGSLHVELGRAERPGQALARISITDTGPGIPPEVLARMFEPFYTTKASGTGLGLALVRRIVEAHQGAVEVHSQVGQGTTFTVHLPLAQAPRTASA